MARLPQPLALGTPVTCRVQVSDELAHWQSQGMLAAVSLTVKLSNYEHAGDLNSVAVLLNGKELSQDSDRCTPADIHFHVLPEGPISPYGYILSFSLLGGGGELPIKGENEITVVVRRKDPAFDSEISLADADIEVKYRPHRHFELEPLRY
jgi:hypothetical protein